MLSHCPIGGRARHNSIFARAVNNVIEMWILGRAIFKILPGHLFVYLTIPWKSNHICQACKYFWAFCHFKSSSLPRPWVVVEASLGVFARVKKTIFNSMSPKIWNGARFKYPGNANRACSRRNRWRGGAETTDPILTSNQVFGLMNSNRVCTAETSQVGPLLVDLFFKFFLHLLMF